MASYDALRHVSIGTYIAGDSLVHRLDARTKLIAWGLLLLAILLAGSYSANVLVLACVLGITWLTRLSARYILAGIKPAIPIIVVLSVMQLFFYRGGPEARPLFTWGSLAITDTALRVVIVSLLRFVELLFLTSLLTNTTTTGALTQGLESLLRPLSAIGLPGHELAMVGAVALRFVPILGEELESILQAQASRGVAEELRGRWRFVAHARRTAATIIPLFVDAFRRSEELILAMQARCYRGGRGRTHLLELRLASQDYVTLSVVVLALVSVLILQRSPLP
jgi:energy-coupling factor transport system permease protein